MMLRVTPAGLLAHRLRLILTAVTIVIGAALMAGTFVLTDSVQAATTAAVTTTTSAMDVVQPAAAGGKQAGPASLPAELLDRIRAVPGAASAQGLVTVTKVALIGKDGRPITHRRAANELLTYPAAAALAAQFTIRSGRPPRAPGEAMLDAATARSLGYRAGDRIEVVTTAGPQTLTITGITGFGGADSPPGDQVASFDAPTVLVVPVGTAQRLAVLPGRFTEIDVLAAPGLSDAVLGDRIAPLLPPGAEVLTGAQAAAQQDSAAAGYLGNLRSYLLAFCAAALFVAAFIIAGTFSVLAAQRAREYALLRAIGASRGQLLRSALAEAAILGLAASAAGTGLGVLAAAGLRGLIAVLGGTLPAGGLVFAPRTAVITVVTGTVVTVASTLRAARRAAGTEPVRALREAASPGVRRSRGRLAVTAVAAAAAIVLLAAGVLAPGVLIEGSQSTALAGALAAAVAFLAGAPLLAGPAARLITAPAASSRRSAVTVLLACENIARNPYRTAALAAVLTVGLATAVTVSIIAVSVQAAARDAITGASHADLYLEGSVGPGLAATVAARPGVLATMRADDPLVRAAGAQERVAGIDPGAAASLLDVGVRTGSLATLRGDTVFVSTQQAAGHGWRAGSAVAIDFGSGPRTFLVAGTFADKRFLGDDYLVPITTLFREMPDQQSQADLLLIKTDPGTSPGSVLAGLRPVLARYPDSTLLTAAQERDARAADLGDLSHVLGLFAAAVALTEILAALGIANAMTLAVAERTAELAVMRALGLTRRQLAAMIRVESAITCLLGAVPGAAVGAAAGTAVAATLTRAQTGAVTIGFSLAQVLAAVAVTCLAALLAGILPARQAGHVTVQAIAAD